jgi:hypothetical protein
MSGNKDTNKGTPAVWTIQNQHDTDTWTNKHTTQKQNRDTWSNKKPNKGAAKYC